MTCIPESSAGYAARFGREHIDALSLRSIFKIEPETTGIHQLILKRPFGVDNLNAAANITYTLQDPVIKVAGINLAYKLIDKKDSPIPLMHLNFDGQFTAAKGEEPQKFGGFAVV